ncbi:MAG: hypothetical protein IJW37_05960 [Lachnospiraceae bacterium]|nr:hypothetical protein [Lachnospiraceae bacterium]
MNGAEKLIDLLTAVCLLFLVPLFYYRSVTIGMQAILAGEAGERFLKQVSVSGEITEAVLKAFERELAQYGCENYEMIRLRTLYEPDGEAGVRKAEYVADKAGLCAEIAETGSSRLQKGDKLRLTLYVNEVPAVYFVTVRTGEESL